MLPILALAIGVGVFSWLLRKDAAVRGRMSSTLWIPFIWLLIQGSRPVAAWLGGGGGGEISGNPIDRVIDLGLFFAAFLVLQRRRFPWGSLPVLNTAYFLLMVYFAISAMWAPYPFVALKRWSKEFGNILIVLLIVTEKSPAESFKTVCVRCAYVLFPLSIILIKYYPQFGRAYSPGGFRMVTGVTDQKNSLGLICCVFALALIWDLVDARKHAGPKIPWLRLLPQVIALAIGLWLLVDSDSKTSLLAFLLGLAIFFGPHLRVIRRSPTLMATACIVGVSVGLIVAAVWTVKIAPLLNAVGRDATFTQRTEIWRVVGGQGSDPLLGSGFSSFWLDKGESVKDEGIPVRTAHNGYLETYLDGGIIGCVLLFVFLLATCRRLARAFSYDDTFARVLFALAMMSLVMNFSESYFFRLDVIWFAMVLGALMPSSLLIPAPAADQFLTPGEPAA